MAPLYQLWGDSHVCAAGEAHVTNFFNKLQIELRLHDEMQMHALLAGEARREGETQQLQVAERGRQRG